MQFVFPGFLYALLAVAIPILIHLFHFRRFKKVYFPNIGFLQQLSDATRRQSKLKHLLVLIARVLAIIFLVLAFSRPYIPLSDTSLSREGNRVGVYLDNSFSMDALAASGRLIDEGRERARMIAGQYQPGDQFMLLTNDFEGRHQRFVSREEFLEQLDEVKLSPAIRTTREVISRMSSLFEEESGANVQVFLISDFQKNITDLSAAEHDSLISIFLVPVFSQAAGNVFADSCWFGSPTRVPGQVAQLHVRIRNDGAQDLVGQPLRLFVEGIQRSVASYDLPAGEETEVVVSWTLQQAGMKGAFVEILDYPVTFDDRLYFSYEVSAAIPVLSVNESGPGPYIPALFGNDTLFTLNHMPVFAVDYSSFQQYSMIIINGLNALQPALISGLQQFVDQGGSLLVFPGEHANLQNYRELSAALQLPHYLRKDTVSMRVNLLNELHPLFTGVFEEIPEQIDLPLIKQHMPIATTALTPGESLLQLPNGHPFLFAQTYKSGKVYLSAVPLEESFSNFPRHPLFVPVMLNMALQSGGNQTLFYTIGRNTPVLLSAPAEPAQQLIRLHGEGIEVIPEQRRSGGQVELFFHDQIREAGNYSLYSGERIIQGLSFNYDRRESLLAAYHPDSLKQIIEQGNVKQVQLLYAAPQAFEGTVKQLTQGRQLWTWFLIAAMLFFLLESLLLRFWRPA
jgi:hypothetical protein